VADVDAERAARVFPYGVDAGSAAGMKAADPGWQEVIPASDEGQARGDSEGEGRGGDEREEQGSDDKGDDGSAGVEGVGEHGGGLDVRVGHDGDSVAPEISGGEEAGQAVEVVAGPFVEAALEGVGAIEIDDDGSGGEIEEEDGEEPKVTWDGPTLAATPAQKKPTMLRI
jgi:hypothetical protein